MLSVNLAYITWGLCLLRYSVLCDWSFMHGIKCRLVESEWAGPATSITSNRWQLFSLWLCAVCNNSDQLVALLRRIRNLVDPSKLYLQLTFCVSIIVKWSFGRWCLQNMTWLVCQKGQLKTWFRHVIHVEQRKRV